MPNTARNLKKTIDLLNEYGLWTGQHFADRKGGLTISAAAYRAVTGTTPDAFYTDDDQALSLITASDAMETIAYLSLCLDTQPNTTATGGFDYIEHVETYASAPAIGDTKPPETNEVIGRILRAAKVAATLAGATPETRPAA